MLRFFAWLLLRARGERPAPVIDARDADVRERRDVVAILGHEPRRAAAAGRGGTQGGIAHSAVLARLTP